MKDSVADLLRRGIDPVNAHVMTATGKLGTVKRVFADSGDSFSTRIEVRHFNGEPWDHNPLPCLVYVISR